MPNSPRATRKCLLSFESCIPLGSIGATIIASQSIVYHQLLREGQKDKKDKQGTILKTRPPKSTPVSLPECSSSLQFPQYNQQDKICQLLSQINI